ncbi:hypothetical protein N9B94_02580 [Verrucomicrobia bacterium]|nr:hypothetical protein [Verrucomicrobiota bacterium]
MINGAIVDSIKTIAIGQCLLAVSGDGMTIGILSLHKIPRIEIWGTGPLALRRSVSDEWLSSANQMLAVGDTGCGEGKLSK